MTRIRIALAALVLATFAACDSAPRLDLSSEEAFEKSMAEVSASLPDADRERFSAAFNTVALHALGGTLSEVGDDPAARARMLQALTGRTAAQVIADAEAIRAKAGAGENR